MAETAATTARLAAGAPAPRAGSAAVRRGAYYLLLTGVVGGAYLAAAVLFTVLQAREVTDSRAFPVFFTLAVLVLFNPLRTRLQAFIDRVFFRTRYDGAQVLAAVGAELAATLKRERIVALVCDVAGVPSALLPRLARGEVLSAVDSAAEGDLAALRAALAVPLELRGELVGVLSAGRKRSGLPYTAGDVEFLRALAHEAAIALENARSYEALVALNARLEERVRERTAQLEGANGELAQAYAELKNAEVQLVQSEKMAALGRLVAGVAHEINNPVAFISSSVAPLRRRLETAAADASPEVAELLADAREIVAVMARGAERTAAIVKDLRSFSRLGEAARKPVDLHDGLEVSLRLLEPRWRGRIEIHRDYGTLPPVECDPGQMNQVFMNLLANACDAIAGTGDIWITTRADGAGVSVAIRDDGAG